MSGTVVVDHRQVLPHAVLARVRVQRYHGMKSVTAVHGSSTEVQRRGRVALAHHLARPNRVRPKRIVTAVHGGAEHEVVDMKACIEDRVVLDVGLARLVAVFPRTRRASLLEGAQILVDDRLIVFA